MDILHTVEEKYLQAIEEIRYGELPMALRLFQQIVDTDASYGRAYYQLGCIYHYEFKDYQLAGYYYQKCIELDAAFPEVYTHHLKLLITLQMHTKVAAFAATALTIPGVCKATIYESLGLYAEAQQDLITAEMQYKTAATLAANEDDHTLYHGHLKRIIHKNQAKQRMVYAYQGN